MGDVDEAEMLRVFNCGIGMLVILPIQDANNAIQLCKEYDIQAVEIGMVEQSSNQRINNQQV